MITQNPLAFIKQNYLQVIDRIHETALRVGRDPAEVRLVVVTKTHPLEYVEAVVAAGATYLGENYVEEAIPKILGLTSSHLVKWHMVGHVQSRKAALVCQYFHYMHSLDSLKLAARLSRFAGERGFRFPVLIECNLGGEVTKYGFPIWEEESWDALLPEIRQVVELPNLEVCGLMGMAPFFPEAESARPFFRRLRRFQDYLRKHIQDVDWRELSMGMSGDFEVAIEEGSTWVRIGTRIFGPRREE